MATTVDPGEFVPPAVREAIRHGLAAMGRHETDVIVTQEFVKTVRTLTGEMDYNTDRGTGSVAARTITTPAGRPAIVVNWPLVVGQTPAAMERLLAHEAGHVAIHDRREGDLALPLEQPTLWDQVTAHALRIAIDEYRCEAAVYRAGYDVEVGRDDSGIVEQLFELNYDLMEGWASYQDHLDVGRLRHDTLRTVALNIRYFATIAARHLHHDPLSTGNFEGHSQENWTTLIAPTWPQFLELYTAIPDALAPWPGAPAGEAACAALPLLHQLTSSFGFRAGVDHDGHESFHVTMNQRMIEARLDRANAEMAARAG